jgi:hypothetical protein
MNKRRLQSCRHGVNRRLVLVGGVALTAEALMAPRSTRAQAALEPCTATRLRGNNATTFD